MRIAIVEPVGKGGLLHYAFQLAGALAERGVEVALITSRDAELGSLERRFELLAELRLWDPKPTVETTGRRLRALRRIGRGLRYAGAWIRSKRLLDGWRPDWVLLGDLRFAGDLIGVAWLRAAGFRLADICHNVAPYTHAAGGSGRFRSGGAARRVWRATYRRIDRIFVHEESNRQRFLERYEVPAERVTAIPHGDETIFEKLADPAYGSAELKRDLAIPATAPVVLFFGTLAGYKGIDLLVEAFGRLGAGRSDAHLVVAGYVTPGFDLEGLRRLARERGLEGRTRIVPGYVRSERVAAWLRLATVAVFPYREVSQSGALLVAATFGTPVVVSSTGALTDVVREGETGRVVPPGGIDELARAIGDLLDDRARARELGDRLAREVRERASWSGVARRIEETLLGSSIEEGGS